MALSIVLVIIVPFVIGYIDGCKSKSEDHSQMGLSYLYNENPDYKKAVKYFRKAAEQGCTAAEVNLGVCYENEKDYDEAIRWYRKASEHRNEDAMEALERLKNE